MDLPPLQAIVDADVAEAAGWLPRDLASRYLAGGARWLQVRAKRLHSGRLLKLCDEVVELARPYGATVVVNDRADLAWLSGAAGVHLGQEDLAPAAARRLLGAEAIVGYSTHSSSQIASARREPLSYLAVGPVFGTGTKDTRYDAVGLELVRAAAEAAGPACPLVGIGGITLKRAACVLEAGAAAVAVITDLLTGDDPAARVREYLRVLKAG